MPHHVATDISVQRFGFTADDDGRRLVFPRGESQAIEGRSGAFAYGSANCAFQGLAARLDTLRWTVDSATIAGTWMHDDARRIDLAIGRIELPRGAMLTRAEAGLEAVAPEATLFDVRVTVNVPPPQPVSPMAPKPGAKDAKPVAPPAPPAMRQNQLRFLDSLAGTMAVTIKVVLDLPVLGKRTLDQELDVKITEGSFDFRALEDNLNWLEGAFLDISLDEDRLSIGWKVPIFGSARELIAWQLEREAADLAAFGRLPVRALADFRLGSGIAKSDDRNDKKRKVQSLSLAAIDVAISLLAPRSLEVGSGLIMFGGEGAPGMVDLKLAGGITDHGPGKLRGAIGSLDTTVKDLRLGPVQLTADRLHLDSIDELEVVFDGFRPSKATLVIHRVTASNLALTFTRRPDAPSVPA